MFKKILAIPKKKHFPFFYILEVKKLKILKCPRQPVLELFMYHLLCSFFFCNLIHKRICDEFSNISLFLTKVVGGEVINWLYLKICLPEIRIDVFFHQTTWN